MDFSFIIPSHNNHESLTVLIRNIHQIAKSSGSIFELIVVDDASDEVTVACVKKLQRQGFINKSRFLIENVGVSAARNEGLRLAASSRWTVFFDDDDKIDDNFYNALKYAANNRDAEFIVTGYVKSEKEDTTIQFWPMTGRISQLHLAEYIQSYCYAPNRFYAFVHVWSKFYSTRLIRKQKIRFKKEMHLHEDIEFNLNYLSANPVIYYCREKFYYHKISTNSASFRSPWDVKSVMSILVVMRQVTRFLRNNGLNIKETWVLGHQMLWHYILVNMIRSGAKVNSMDKYLRYSKAWVDVIDKPFYYRSIRYYNSAMTGGSIAIPYLIKIRLVRIALIIAFIRGKLRYRKLMSTKLSNRSK